MNKRTTTIALATVFALMAALVIFGNRSDPDSKGSDSALASGSHEHRSSFHGAKSSSGSEDGPSQNLRRRGDPEAGFAKSKKSTAYRGPKGIHHWKQEPDACWEYEDGTLVSRQAGSIAQDSMLPEECTVSFTVERESDQIDLKLMIFSDDTESTRPRSGYELSFQRSSIYLRSGKTRNFLGSNYCLELSENKKAHIEVRASRTTGTIALLINGKISEVWSDPKLKENTFGKSLHFVAGNKQIIHISDIEIDSWNPVTDETLSLDPGAGNIPAAPNFRNFPEGF